MSFVPFCTPSLSLWEVSGRPTLDKNIFEGMDRDYILEVCIEIAFWRYA